MNFASRRVVVVALALMFVVGFAVHAEIPEGVSPGAVDHVAAIDGRCPSFSWGAVPGAEHYRLVCYRLPEWMEPSGIDLERAEQVLQTEIPGTATTWTPSLTQCFAAGESYVWLVRAAFRQERGEVVEASEWSYGRFFEISATGSARDLEEALNVLRRYVGHGRAEVTAIDPGIRKGEVPGTEGPPAGRRPAVVPQGPKSVPSAATAIRGSLSDTTGEAYGFVGISNSVDGAGVGAVGAAGGPDLVLDGSADLLVDAELSQSGIDRRWGSPQTFNIENSMGGGMTLRVDGVVALTTASAVNADTLDGIHGNEFANDPELGMHAVLGDHDGRYFTEAELSTSGGGGAAHWDNLTNVPADLADGDDDTISVLPGSGWRLHAVTIVDGGGDVGVYTSIAVGADGLPVISYHDNTNDDLKVAHCSDLACSSASVTTVDGGGNVGVRPSITVGSDGLPVIAYTNFTSGNLKVAHCSDVACTSATVTTVESAGVVGYTPSITIGADGLPVISHHDWTNKDLKVAHCSNLACTSATKNTVDGVDDVGLYTSIKVGGDGLPVISYYDSTNEDLKVAHCSDVACSAATVNTVDSTNDVGEDTSITIGLDGLPVISYRDSFNSALKAAHCSDVACTTATITTVDNDGNVGRYSSITIGADGLPVISYYDSGSSALKVAHCSDVACATATTYTVDNAGSVGSYPSVAVGGDSLPVISYYDATNDDLKVAHCSNVFCIPYARRR